MGVAGKITDDVPYVGAEELIYCKKYRKEEFDTDLEDFEEQSEWDSEDEWESEDGAEDARVADNTNASSTAELSK